MIKNNWNLTIFLPYENRTRHGAPYQTILKEKYLENDIPYPDFIYHDILPNNLYGKNNENLQNKISKTYSINNHRL